MRNLLYFLRKSKDLRQYKLAEKLGVSSSYLSKVETGQQEPTEDFKKRCAEYFGLPVDVIFPSEDKFDEMMVKYVGGNGFRNNLWKIRRLKGIKQQDLARMLGVSPSHLSKIENGLQLPTRSFVEKCAKILGVSLEELFPDGRFIEDNEERYFRLEKEDVERVNELSTVGSR